MTLCWPKGLVLWVTTIRFRKWGMVGRGRGGGRGQGIALGLQLQQIHRENKHDFIYFRHIKKLCY